MTPHAEAIIRDKVTRSLYPDAGAAIETAVRLLEEHDRRMQRLLEAIAAGEEGEALPWTPELIEQLSRQSEEMQHRGESPDPDVCPLGDVVLDPAARRAGSEG